METKTDVNKLIKAPEPSIGVVTTNKGLLQLSADDAAKAYGIAPEKVTFIQAIQQLLDCANETKKVGR